jgi:hypothetical protein
VLVVGGGNPSALRSAELYDPAARRWSRTGSTIGYGGTAVLLRDGRVLIAGSGNEGEIYSPATGTWTPTGPVINSLVTGRAAAVLPSGEVLYAGGARFSCGVKQCFYDPSADAEVYTP